tara:strand:- start:120 stop:518 length:399 start_codon:yes stop_codon:yes gene_type:complete
MQLLTMENARKILKKGCSYRIGTNALNNLEFIYDHQGFKSKNPNFKITPPALKGAKQSYLNGTIEWLDADLLIEETNYRLSAMQNIRHDDLRCRVGVFTSWNGEPLWVLEEGEKVEDIASQDLNEMMLPNLF